MGEFQLQRKLIAKLILYILWNKPFVKFGWILGLIKVRFVFGYTLFSGDVSLIGEYLQIMKNHGSLVWLTYIFGQQKNFEKNA